MQWSDIQFRPDARTLRQFAGLWLVCFGGLAAWEGFGRGHTTAATALGILALAVGVPGLLRPQVLRPIYVGWMVLAFPIGWTISQIILAVMYYGLFTPIGLIFRLIGRDSLHRARRPGQATYWAPKATPTDPRRYLKQF
ncbi:SxtJ family membrane protein [Aquisphaera insulae]|uniref:SxtJ family membrane protein n=1 Tax=Aquisphaera insulae TaxID=2712864 RepID=UPI0013ECE9D9|nr:SxtJ family membrane protein [Aquisphaera insulae]